MKRMNAVELSFYRRGWVEVQTGGGCTAFMKLLPGEEPGGKYYMVTDVGGMATPSSLDEPMILGLYNGEGEQLDWLEIESTRIFLNNHRPNRSPVGSPLVQHAIKGG